jgi:hypothetical protein
LALSGGAGEDGGGGEEGAGGGGADAAGDGGGDEAAGDGGADEGEPLADGELLSAGAGEADDEGEAELGPR